MPDTGIASTLAAISSAAAQMLVSLSTTPNGAYLAESIIDLTIPLAFLVAVVQRTLLLRNIVPLIEQLSGVADVRTVVQALQSFLHDPTLDVILSDPAGESESTAIAKLDVAPEGRLVEFVRTEEGNPIAVIIADSALGRHRPLFDTGVHAITLNLRNAQLQAQAAREKLQHVRALHARVIEAGLAERRRLERDLHDGVQQRILSLGARLATAMAQTSDPAAKAAFVQAKDGLSNVLSELRELAHGIHPVTLTQSGLVAALEEVAERLPVPVQVIGPESRTMPSVEAAAYYVACEALTNVVKHAQATSVTVTVELDDAHLVLKIIDDGVGGIGADGNGLGNIRDRVSAVDGQLTIESPPGVGTRLLARIPCV